MIDRFAALLEWPLVRRDAFERCDAIVVLGAPLARDRLTPMLAERCAAAAALWHAGGAPQVVATGGTTRGASRAEADVMAEALRAAGIPEDALVVERASQTTADNARLTAALLPGARSVWLVTQPFHGRRAAHLFARAGLVPRVWHIADSLEYRDRRRAARWLVREYAAWLLLMARR